MKKNDIKKIIEMVYRETIDDRGLPKPYREGMIEFKKRLATEIFEQFPPLDEILREVDLAKCKHPIWPRDPIHAAAIVGEESGELLRAAIQFKYEGGSINAITIEAIQTAATAIRLLQNISNYEQ